MELPPLPDARPHLLLNLANPHPRATTTPGTRPRLLRTRRMKMNRKIQTNRLESQQRPRPHKPSQPPPRLPFPAAGNSLARGGRPAAASGGGGGVRQGGAARRSGGAAAPSERRQRQQPHPPPRARAPPRRPRDRLPNPIS